MVQEQKHVLVIAGASGSGKSTVVKYLKNRYPDMFEVSVSFTTRSPREKEIDGKEYHFVSQEKFTKKVRRGDFLEYAEYAGNYYGTDRSCTVLKDPSKILILEIEKNGVKNVKSHKIPAVFLYILADIDVLHKRISERALISRDELSTRLMKAAEENIYGMSGAFDEVIKNIDINQTFTEVDAFLKKYFHIKSASENK